MGMHVADRRRRLRYMLASTSFVMCVGVFMVLSRRGIAVSVANQMDGELRNIAIDYAGGQLLIPRIGHGSSFEATIVPKSESSLDLSFTDSSNRTRSEKIGVYFEPGYAGAIRIVVLPNGHVEYEDRTRLHSWLPL